MPNTNALILSSPNFQLVRSMVSVYGPSNGMCDLRYPATASMSNTICAKTHSNKSRTINRPIFGGYITSFMSVPETAVYENDCPILSEHQIRMYWKARMIQSVSEPTTEQKLPYQQFRLRIPPFYC